MSRPLTPGMVAAITASTVWPFLLFEADFASGTVRLWSGLGDLTWNSQTWSGVGNLVQVGATDETDDIKAQGVTVTVAGIDSTLLGDVLSQVQSNQPGLLYLGCFDSSGNIVADPQVIFTGRLDVAVISDKDPAKPLLQLTYENDLTRLELPKEKRWTDAQQQADFSGDTGLSRIAALQDTVIDWGPT